MSIQNQEQPSQSNPVAKQDSYSPHLLDFPDVPGLILPYLRLRNIKSALPLNRGSYQALKMTGMLELLKTQNDIEQNYIQQFCHLIAIDGEDNQNKANAMLVATSMEDPGLLFPKLVGRTTVCDAAGRIFQNISAYGYAFWSGDTRMRQMMEQHMDAEMKATAYKECKSIADKGISFTFEGETINGSKHFDFQPLLNAYLACLAEVNPLWQQAGNINNEAWARADELWLELGKEQAKLPTHVAQEYCGNLSFSQPPTFREPDLNRGLRICFYGPGPVYSSWGFGVHSDLGQRYAIFKGRWNRPVYSEISPRNIGAWRHFERDMLAIITLSQFRVVDELNQTLEVLEQPEYIARLNR